MSTKKDFRNMQQTQFDRGQVLKGSFSELNSALRTVDSNAILKDAYTHFTQTVNGDGKPLAVTYYQAGDPAQDELIFVADVSQSLAGTYFVLQEFLTKKTHAFYYVVDGNGTAPGVADVETPVNISENDLASTVCFATKNVMDTVDEFIITSKNFLANSIQLEYLQFGETDAVDLGTSGFFVTRIKDGTSVEVGSVELTYDVDGSPIYNGNTLKGLIYNPYTASFDVEFSEVTATVNLDPIISKLPEIFEVSMPLANTEYSLALPLDTKRFAIKIQDNLSKYSVGYVSGGNKYSVSRGTEYSEEGLEITSGNETIYFQATKPNMVMEIITWK